MKSKKLKVNRKIRNEGRPGYKKIRVGWIPEEWGIASLKEVAKLERGRFSARPRNDPRYYGGTIPFVQTGDISSANLYIQAHSQTLNQAGLTVSKIFPKGTILMTIAANIGDVAISKYELACPDSLVGINGNQNVNQLWLFYYLSTQKLNLEVQAPQNAQKNINLEILGPHPIPIPPLPEQKKIAEILFAWDRAIEITNRLITNYELLKKGLMQQLLTGRMRFLEFGKPVLEKGELPKGWKFVTLENLATVSTGSKDNKDKIEGGKYPFFVRSQTIERINSYSYDGEAILVPGEGKIGDVIHYINTKFDFHQRVYKISDFHTLVYGLFLFYNLKHYFPQQARRFSVKMTADSLRRSAFTSMKLLIPSHTEQVRIAAVLSTCDRELEILKKKLEKLKGQKKGLMQKLLTGEIRHPEFLKCEERKVKCEKNSQNAKIRNS